MRTMALIVAALLLTFAVKAAPLDALIGIWCGPEVSYEFWKDRLIVKNKDKTTSVRMIDHAKSEGEGEVLVYWSPYCPVCATLFVIDATKLNEVGRSGDFHKCGSVSNKSETR